MTETPSATAENAVPEAAETTTETTTVTTPPAKKAAAKGSSKGGGLSSMLLADLKSMAGGLGIAVAGSMKKAQLVEAIKGAQESSRAAAAARQEARKAS